jgi:hypothetical protein
MRPSAGAPSRGEPRAGEKLASQRQLGAGIRRTVAARIAADLLAELDRPPPPASRLHLE